MTLNIRQMTAYRRDIKRLSKSRRDLSKLQNIIQQLVQRQTLDARQRDHALVGNWRGYRECHVVPDWLLIYKTAGNELWLIRTGSHSELF